jgi:TonB family protein
VAEWRVSIAAGDLMRGWQCVALVGLLAVLGICAAQSPPPDAAVRAGRTAFGYDPARRCPDLTTTTTDQAVAVIVFRVGDTGAPSAPSVKSPSGSEQLDAAATACVLKLRFFPVLRAGDGTAVESWQQMTFAWKAPPPQQKALAHCDPSAAPAAAAAKGSAASANPPLPRQGKVGVCVCVDESGKLAHAPTVLQSAGDSGLDKAAIDIATTGHYQPSTQNGKAVSDCFPLTVKFEVQ